MDASKVPPLIYVIILNWNGREHLEYCIPSVLASRYLNFRILLVDNGSIDNSAAFVRQKFPEVTIICNKRNLGYAKGNNVGIKYALKQRADYVVILNNDMKVDPRWISEAVKVAEYNPKIGIIGFKVFGEYKRENENEFKRAQKHFSAISIKPTNFITGCALFIRSQVFREVGLFDEGYFLYADEDDFELRLSRAGFTMVRINIPLWHKGEGSIKTNKIKIMCTYYSFKSLLRFNLKNYGFEKAFRKVGGLLFYVYFRKREDSSRRYYQRLRGINPFLSLALFFFAVISTFFSAYEIAKARRWSRKALNSTKTGINPTTKKRVKVLHIIPGLGIGGAERSVVDLLKALHKQGFKVVLCCLDPKKKIF